MATHHSRSKRTKSHNTEIVVPSWDSVWQSFKNDHQKTTTEKMAVNGWKLLTDIAKNIGLSRQAVFDLIAKNKMESTKRKIDYAGKTREMVFVRPKTNVS